MGMAASQARFLSLTARKSNVEYEGQQVNQQRTALSTESANLYNKLSAIKVPTPPVTTDYYETVYTFSSADLDKTSTSNIIYTLEDIYAGPGSDYARLSYNTKEWKSALTTAYSGDINAVHDPSGSGEITGYQVQLVNGYTANAVRYYYHPTENSLNFNIDEDTKKVVLAGIEFTLSDDGTVISSPIDPSNPDTKYYSHEVIKNADGSYTIKIGIDKTTNPAGDPVYSYKIGNQEFPVTLNADGTYSCELPTCSTGDVKNEIKGKYFDSDDKVNSSISYFNEGFFETTDEPKLKNQPIIGYYPEKDGKVMYYITAQEFKKGVFSSSSYVHQVENPVKVDYRCRFTTSKTGRYKTLTVIDDNDREFTFELAVKSNQDEEAFKQANLDYEYQKALYDKQIADINAKTKAIQEQDRTLELRLKQLDTEQEALKTEMESISKVIEDNVDKTFKTFD